ncbi:hypothetical protein EJ03DRAFT_158221 [Teratosphaeria nubilosa]|uniref:Uncharacterized protein n=1 Tax=Teratosphaeria nubilosa TaxID=161662 RepID=A0A6G1L3K9_9PEZI|nr:hypothetical protein EJ03DRAFT_158221 [Teratosphaeria nubilosa]
MTGHVDAKRFPSKTDSKAVEDAQWRGGQLQRDGDCRIYECAFRSCCGECVGSMYTLFWSVLAALHWAAEIPRHSSLRARKQMIACSIAGSYHGRAVILSQHVRPQDHFMTDRSHACVKKRRVEHLQIAMPKALVLRQITPGVDRGVEPGDSHRVSWFVQRSTAPEPVDKTILLEAVCLDSGPEHRYSPV